jgi:acetyl-CoA synthetase
VDVDMGWVVGPLIVYTTPLIGATLVLGRGRTELHPIRTGCGGLVAEHGVTYLGVAPTTIRTFMAQGSEPWKRFDLSKLRVMLSSGEPWTPQAWAWLFESVGRKRVPLLNFTGGTGDDGHPRLLPAAPAEALRIQYAGAGNRRRRVRRIRDGPQRRCRRRAVMRRHVMGLTQGLMERRRALHPELLEHVDGRLAPRRFCKPRRGRPLVHLGPLGRHAEDRRQAHRPFRDRGAMMATGQARRSCGDRRPDPIKGSTLVLVCVQKPGVEVSADELSYTVVHGLGTPFKPKAVLFVPDLPKTRNLKIMRRVIRAAYLGENPGDLSSLVNPESIDEIRARR